MLKDYYSELLPVLAERAKLAAISRLGFANTALRRHLAQVFDRSYGQNGSFLGDPTFEAVFGWHKAERTMGDLADSLLTPELVTAMDEPPEELRKDYRFDRQRQPYKHQLEAWRILAQSPPRSLVVASGTGSGKTECFMVPILDRLVRQRNEQNEKLVGVRALFLYPLNALINSQRERLRAWTHAFDGDIRYCLYNGNTPDSEPERVGRDNPGEVVDRVTLRGSPPPILVTNATMLEYMLVRTADAPILDQSRGKLEWVVLDEAHTYVGSQAAEAALLIRRVLFSFGVTPEQVRFVATSATIGDPEGEAGQKLKRFLAEVAGVPLDRVHLVAGARDVPLLEGATSGGHETLSDLCAIDPDREASKRRHDALIGHPVARSLRRLFVGPDVRRTSSVATLSDVCRVLFGAGNEYSIAQQRVALQWLDLLSATRPQAGGSGDDDIAFLPLRAHLFHQTMPGLWACADPQCREKHDTELADSEWAFGQVYLEPRKRCICGSPTYDVVACDECGTVHLLAGEYRGVLTHLQSHAALDEFELDSEPGVGSEADEAPPDEQAAAGRQNEVLIVNRALPRVGPMHVERDSRRLTESSDNTLTVLVCEDDGDGLNCPACNGHPKANRPLFQRSRIGAPFLLSSILPTLLEYAPDGDQPVDHPYRGRRLLTFNDSRQGTARLAAKLQQESERSRVRGLVYHITLQHGRGASAANVRSLEDEIRQLEEIHKATENAALAAMIAAKRQELARQAAPVPLGFHDLAQKLAGQGSDFDRMLAHYRRLAPGVFSEATGPGELARMFLVREFGRRPKRLNNLESMGLVAVRYPALSGLDQVPQSVANVTDFDLVAWRDFLKICLDFYVRAGGSLAISSAWRNWLGFPFPQTRLVERDQQQVARNQRRWPRAVRGGLRATLVRLLAHSLKVDIGTPSGEDRVDEVLKSAWSTLCEMGLLQQTGDGRVLPLDALAFAPMSVAWICPVTRRFLDTTLRGLTPYLPERATDRTALGRRIELPMYDEPFAGVTEDLERIRRGREWLGKREDISALREQGVWLSLNDRVIELAPYFTAAEHSAQQDSRTLDRYEKDFKAGALNLLSCSTTMEMGIDIGGISFVAMNNVPPHPANYLQRAGRAGRRKESRSVAMTLCKSNPHDQAVFANSRWAFDTPLPAPQVSLDSPIIAQRHVRSLLLSRFLAEALEGSGQDQLKLTCGTFFNGERTLADRYAAWCRAFSAVRSEHLAQGLRQLVRGTVFEGNDLSGVAELAAQTMDDVAREWRMELASLEREAAEVRRGGESSPACKAVRLHMERLSGEYLLKELAGRGYLPAYGFPTHLAPFDNLTRSRLSRLASTTQQGRDDNRYRRRELPCRELMTALREYAPGSEVVMDGLVYRSAGVTLNWHIPADQEDVREVQDIRLAWRCTQCGASGSGHSLEAVGHCTACGSAIAPERIREFIEPAGFAVDFYRDPTNDVTVQHFVPVEAPWIDASGDWHPLPNPALGRFRASSNGHVFHQSRGLHGEGYALCLECGRAEPMLKDQHLPAVFQNKHTKLRRTKEEGLFCPGSDSAWKIKQGITLGHEGWTDVLEIQLKTLSGAWLYDDVAARTLAVALRDALAELIGVQATELGCDVKESKPEPGARCQSILIFDRFAAGYASSADRYLGRMFALARQRLQCAAECDSACPRCVLDFDQRFAADSLDRYAALEVLTQDWVNGLVLPPDLAFFGSGSHPEYQPLANAVFHTVSRRAVGKVRLHAGGAVDQWDVGPSTLRELAYRLAGQGVGVELVVPAQVPDGLDEADQHLLASLVDHPRVTMSATDQPLRCGAGWVLAEALSDPPVRWGVATEAPLTFGAQWGESDGPLIMSANGEVGELPGRAISAASLRPAAPVVGDLELEVHHELDGPLQGFGARFWALVADHHPAVHKLLEDSADEVVSVRYRDRYLFTPLSVSLLLDTIAALRQVVGEGRWNPSSIDICTTNRRPSGATGARGTVWSDWPENAVRDRVVAESFAYAGMCADLQLGDAAGTGHGRLLEVRWSSGATLGIRLDQGVSYWRAAPSSARAACYFNFHQGDTRAQAERVAELRLRVEGAQLPTQIFVKVRTTAFA